MASPLSDEILEISNSSNNSNIPIEHSEVIAIEPPKFKGRAKFIHGLSRISSSPSLVQLSRRRATSSPYPGRGSLSCVSLASASAPLTYGGSSSPQTPGEDYSTAPTTPGLDTPFFDGTYGQNPIRKVDIGAVLSGTSTPTSPLPEDIRPGSNGALSPFPEMSAMPEILEDYFSLPVATSKPRVRRVNFNFWGEMPYELKLSVFSYLEPKEKVRASIVSKDFFKICFDGQLWTSFDATEFYRDIPAESLAKILVAAGPFVKDLNLRGCVQMQYQNRAEVIARACSNLVSATLEGCRNFDRSTLHNLLRFNERLAVLDLTGLPMVTNATCKLISSCCPSLEVLNVSWCAQMDARGIKNVIVGCTRLRDLRAGEVRGFGSIEIAQLIFETNRLEHLVLPGCADITDDALRTMIVGTDPQIDILTDLPMVPTRKLRRLDLSHCTRLTSIGIKSLAHFVPDLEGLRVSYCTALTDTALSELIATTPHLTILDLEELTELTNTFLSDNLAKAPCASILEHLSLSYCENLGDTGMLPVIKACTSLKSITMDNTRISDLVLAEAASMVRSRSSRTSCSRSRPRIGLQLTVYDCQNVTWTGIREVLSRNSEVKKPTGTQTGVTYPTEIIETRCFYAWQMTVDEHMKRVLRGDLPAAGRLERKWAEYMMANEEASANGAGNRRRRRRAREAQMLHADEEQAGVAMGGIGRRRRARSSGCSIM